MLTAWEESFGHAPTSVASAVAAANAPGMSAQPQLLDALRSVAGERNGDINSKRLGRYLVRNVRRIEGGRRFEDGGEDSYSKCRLYRVGVVSGVTGVSGVSGVSGNPSRETHT